MPLATLDDLIGGTKGAGHIFKSTGIPTVIAGQWSSLWASSAIPGPGSLAVGNTTTGTIPTRATAGAMAFTNPPAGDLAYVLGATVMATQTGTVMLYDRVWHLGSLAPAAGAYAGIVGLALDRPADGVGVELWAEINGALSTSAHTLTIGYLDQDGNAGTATVTLPASAPAARLYPVTLAAGDSGVRQVTDISGSASPPTGTFNLIALRPILRVGVVANIPARLGLPDCGLRPLYADSCLAAAFYATSATAPTVQIALDLVTG